MNDPSAHSPLDTAITITVFPDVFAKAKDPQHVALNVFSAELRDARAPDKYQLKLFSPGSYGSKRTAAKALRHDNNIVELFAVVGDYDGGKVSVDEAAAALEAAGVCALVITTPSHTSTFPKWRVIAPLSDPLHRARANATGFELADYHKLVSRLAGVLPDGLAAESWNRSQGWFIGTVDGALDHQVRHVPGVCLDLLPVLDVNARPRPSPPVKLRAKRGISRRRAEPIPIPGLGPDEGLSSQTEIPDAVLALDLEAALEAIATGEDSHDALVAAAGAFAADGTSEAKAIAMLTFAANQRPPERRDTGWHSLINDIRRTVAWALEKEAEKQAAAVLAIMTGPTSGQDGNGAAPPPPPPGGAGWMPPPFPPGSGPGAGTGRGALMRSNRAKNLGNLANVITCLRECPELIGCAGYDQMALDVVLLRALPGQQALAEPRQWTEIDTSDLQDFLQLAYQMGRVGRETVQQGVEKVARDYAFHPIRQYLDRLSWDGTKRISTWLTDYLGVEPSEYAQATGRMWAIGMVARVTKPGSKFDYMLVLEGLQGTFKSEVCNALCGPWTSDQVLDIRTDSRAVSQHLRNVWLVEISELTLFKRPEGVELLKAFLSRRREKYLSRYARAEVIEPRQCGFIGSTNQDTYLHDPTGNRRIWPHHTGNIAVRSLMRDRDQFWAEAVVAYRAGEIWWPTPAFEKRVIQPQQDQRYQADAWLEPIQTELARLQVVAVQARAKGKADARARSSMTDIWKNAMAEPGMAVSTDATTLRFDRTAQQRVREILRFLGWRPGTGINGRTQWEAPSA
jgi:hypothetical protein